jgi:hypothetical protein
MGHSLPEIEKDALGLSPEDRARLAVRLISSLEESGESPEQIEKLWIAEAERRFQELRDGVVRGISAKTYSLSCGIKKREGGDFPPGRSGGDERIFRFLSSAA